VTASFANAAYTTITMAADASHSACVDAWMERVAKDLPPERLIQAFEQAFGAVWRRAHQTLGDVTLTAIADRVLHNAAEQFALLSTLAVEVAGLRCQQLRERAAGLHREELAAGLRYVLVEFLAVLGNLTADILTPALHAELSRVSPRGATEPGEGAGA
jgi:hypothetical protein